MLCSHLWQKKKKTLKKHVIDVKNNRRQKDIDTIYVSFFRIFFNKKWTMFLLAYINSTWGFHFDNSIDAYIVLWTGSPLYYIHPHSNIIW
jgi:hypothetical protein